MLPDGLLAIVEQGRTLAYQNAPGRSTFVLPCHKRLLVPRTKPLELSGMKGLEDG